MIFGATRMHTKVKVGATRYGPLIKLPKHEGLCEAEEVHQAASSADMQDAAPFKDLLKRVCMRGWCLHSLSPPGPAIIRDRSSAGLDLFSCSYFNMQNARKSLNAPQYAFTF